VKVSERGAVPDVDYYCNDPFEFRALLSVSAADQISRSPIVLVTDAVLATHGRRVVAWLSPTILTYLATVASFSALGILGKTLSSASCTLPFTVSHGISE